MSGIWWCQLHLLSVSVLNSCLKTARQDAEQTWADLGLQLSGIWWCQLHLLSVSVLNTCLKTARQDAEQTWGDLGLQLSGICGVCICSFYLVLGGEGGKEKERRSGEEEKSNNPNLKGGE